MNRRNYFEPISLFNELNRLVDRPNFALTDHSGPSNVERSQWLPSVDVKEDDKQFIFLADLPGIAKEDIHISTDNHVLTIKGERHSEQTNESENFARIERVHGSFCRQFSLPRTADISNIQAKLDKGVLQVFVPKKSIEQSARVRIDD